jgi:alkyl hydroperoxide reductase subunit AhpF
MLQPGDKECVEAERAKEYSVDKVPAIAIVGTKDYGIRYYGIPYGYEFNPFIDNIISVSNGTTDLSEDTKNKLKTLDKPVHIKVFVTLTCPYCSIVAGLAQKGSQVSPFGSHQRLRKRKIYENNTMRS